MNKNPLMSVATVLLLVASLFTLSCRTAYQKVVTDTHRTEQERSLLAKACREEFPTNHRFVPGSVVHTDTSFVYDEDAITELNSIIDSLLVLDEANRDKLRARADSITHMLWERSRLPVVTNWRVDTVFSSDSAALSQANDRENVLREDLVRAHGETISAGMDRDAARAGENEAREQAHYRLWWLIISNLILLCILFRKPLVRAIAAAFKITLKI